MPHATDRTLQDFSKCLKCGSTTKDAGEFRASGGFWSSFFDLSNRRFRYLTCRRCGFTEFYNAQISGAAKVFDFLGSA